MLTPFVVAILFFAIGAVVYVLATPPKAQEIGRALLWVGTLLLGLALTGLHL